jgi:hypothetical protein
VRRLLALALLVGAFPASSIADPTPFASVSVGCDPEFPSTLRRGGVRSGSLKSDGRVVRRFSKEASFAYRSRRGWRRGWHTLRLSATDLVGNSDVLVRRFLMR